MWELDYNENWALKNWCFWTVVLEKTLESPLDCKEIQPVLSKGLFIGRTDVEVKTPILWPLDLKSWLIGKDPHSGNMRAGGERDDRGWDGWMASPTQCTWVWVNSGNWWWTRRPGMLQSMGLQRVGHNWVIELNWTEMSRQIRNILLQFMSKSVLPMVFSRGFIVPSLTLRSLTHFKFIFAYSVRACSNFILLHAAVQVSKHHLLKKVSFHNYTFLPPLS